VSTVHCFLIPFCCEHQFSLFGSAQGSKLNANVLSTLCCSHTNIHQLSFTLSLSPPLLPQQQVKAFTYPTHTFLQCTSLCGSTQFQPTILPKSSSRAQKCSSQPSRQRLHTSGSFRWIKDRVVVLLQGGLKCISEGISCWIAGESVIISGEDSARGTVQCSLTFLLKEQHILFFLSVQRSELYANMSGAYTCSDMNVQ
jgi:hypothetical protein